MNTATKILTIVAACLIIASIAVTFYRRVVLEDYAIDASEDAASVSEE